MVKVIIRTAVSGTAEEEHGLPRDYSFTQGQHIEVSEEKAKAWQAAGVCEIVGEVNPASSATEALPPDSSS